MRLILLAFFAFVTRALGAQTAAGSTPWVSINRDQTELVQLDTTRTARQAGGELIVWLKTTYPQTRVIGGPKPFRYDYRIAKEGIDCRSKRFRVYTLTFYDRDGTPDPESVSGSVPDWEDPAPESHAESWLRAICALYQQ